MLSAEERDHLDRIFHQFDRKKSGEVSRTLFKRILNLLEFDPNSVDRLPPDTHYRLEDLHRVIEQLIGEQSVDREQLFDRLVADFDEPTARMILEQVGEGEIKLSQLQTLIDRFFFPLGE